MIINSSLYNVLLFIQTLLFSYLYSTINEFDVVEYGDTTVHKYIQALNSSIGIGTKLFYYNHCNQFII